MVSIFTGVQYYQRMKHMVRDKDNLEIPVLKQY